MENLEVIGKILTMVWAFLNSAFGLGMVVTAVVWIGAKIYAAHPSWHKYEGSIIEAVKYAEKAIPDDTENKAARKFDCALRYVLKIHNDVENRTATPLDVAKLSEGIRIVQAELEANGNLAKPTSTLLAILLCCALLFSGLGCQVIFQTPESGPATVGSPNNSAVTTEGQQTDSNQGATPPVDVKETPNDVGN